MASNPLFIICTRLFLHFLNELNYGYLRFEGDGTFSLPPKGNFPISFKPKVAIAEFFWKMQRKPGIPFLGWTPCLFPSKNCRFEKYMEMMKGGRWFKKTFFQLSKNDPSSFKTNYVCLPTPGAPLESSGSFGLWLLSLSISLLACS